jgi:tRNA1(Val) A37 N6-methylase TrmN6
MDTIAELDSLLDGRVKVAQPAEGYRVAVDAVLLAAAVDAPQGAAVLDLGCGVGSVGLCLAWRRPDLSITGLDREPIFAATARTNAVRNGFADRLNIIEADVRAPLPRKFDHVAMNPPYLKAGTATVSSHPLTAAATAESEAKLADWIAAARDALKPGGILLIEAFSLRQLDLQKAHHSGGPREASMLFSAEKLRADFASRRMLHLEELEIDLDEGHRHSGRAAVVRCVVEMEG